MNKQDVIQGEPRMSLLIFQSIVELMSDEELEEAKRAYASVALHIAQEGKQYLPDVQEVVWPEVHHLCAYGMVVGRFNYISDELDRRKKVVA